jgi:threonine/homoserine/homoserine lactone efflux protein
MPLLGLFFTSFVVGLSGALMPGPLLVATVKEAYHRGALAGPLLTLGHGIIESVMVVALAFGLARFVSSDLVMAVVGSAGGLALILLGYGMIRDVLQRRISLAPAQEDRVATRFGSVLDGIVASVVNPYWVTWWLTIGATYVLLSLKHGVIGLPFFYVGHILSDLTWLTFVSVTLAQGKKLIGEQFYLGLIFVCGLFLWALALWFIYSGVRAFI